MHPRLLVYALGASLAISSANASAATPGYQGALSAKITGPRKIAATPEGEIFVVDARARLHRLTRRGDEVGVVLEDVAAVAAASGAIFAANLDGTIAQLNPRTGRVLRATSLGTSEIPAALAYDAQRGKLWIAFVSGGLQARTLDGAVANDIPAGAGGSYGLAGVAVDPAGTVWVLQAGTATSSTLRAYDADSGALVGSYSVAVGIAGGVAFSGGSTYVPDVFAGTVQIFGADGTSAGAFGERGDGPGQLAQPTGLAFLGNGDVAVANLDANRVDRFGDGTPLPSCPGDTDCDGLPDEWELANGLDPNDPTDALADLDRDGLNNSEEYAYGTNPRSADSDGDGYSDAQEIASGFNPLDASDHRPQLVASGGGTTDPGLVRLSATVSDVTGAAGACAARWTQVAGPASVVLQGDTTLTPSFVVRKAGAYQFQVVATCGKNASQPARVDVTVNNLAPRPDGGRTVVVAAGRLVELSGKFTTDANADDVTMAWDQELGAPVTGTVPGAALAARIDQPGYYVFRLGAADRAGAEAGAEVPIVVVGEEPTPTAAAPSPIVAQTGQAVTLDASGSWVGRYGGTYAWRQVEGPAVALQDASAPVTSFVAGAPGRYAFELTVANGRMRSPPARVEVYAAAGSLPVAVATADRTVAAVNTPVRLDGSASTSSGGALAYAWRQVSGPAAGLTQADAASATAVPFQPGSYEFELGVTADGAVSLPARVRVEARVNDSRGIPVAAVAAWPTARAGDLVVMDGRASRGAARWRWTQVAGPWVAVDGGSVAWFRPVIPGVYAFELEVDDGLVRSAPTKIGITVTRRESDEHGEDNDD